MLFLNKTFCTFLKIKNTIICPVRNIEIIKWYEWHHWKQLIIFVFVILWTHSYIINYNIGMIKHLLQLFMYSWPEPTCVPYATQKFYLPGKIMNFEGWYSSSCHYITIPRVYSAQISKNSNYIDIFTKLVNF